MTKSKKISKALDLLRVLAKYTEEGKLHVITEDIKVNTEETFSLIALIHATKSLLESEAHQKDAENELVRTCQMVHESLTGLRRHEVPVIIKSIEEALDKYERV